MQIEVIQGDITQAAVDVIVNAANPALAPGGGVCGSIHRAAGPKLAKECADYAHGIHTGSAGITNGYNLPARFVVHAVGPIFNPQQEPLSALLLASAYQSSLDLAWTKNASTIAFPAISTGIYGYPPEKAAATAVLAIKEWDLHNDHGIQIVYLMAFDTKTYEILRAAVG